MRKLVLSVIIVFLISTTAFAQVDNKIAAIVNGKIITLFDVNQEASEIMANMKRQGRNIPLIEIQKHVLDQMITDQVLLAEADRLQIKTSPSDIAKRVADLRKQANMTQSQFWKEIAKRGLTRDVYEKKLGDTMRRQRLISAMVSRKVLITDEDLKKFTGEKLSDTANLAQSISLKVLFCKSKEGAEKIYKAVSSGKVSLEQTPAYFSSYIRREGSGNVGVVRVASLDKDLQAAVEKTKPKHISTPVPYRGSWLLIAYEKVADNYKSPDGRTGAESLRETLYQQKAQKIFDDYIKKLRAQTIVENRLF